MRLTSCHRWNRKLWFEPLTVSENKFKSSKKLDLESEKKVIVVSTHSFLETLENKGSFEGGRVNISTG